MFFLKGLLMGLMAGFPAGPLGVIAIREMVSGKVKQGFLKGMGAVFANFLYAMVIAFSLGFAADFLLKYQTPIRTVGSLLIIAMGISIILRKEKSGPKEKNSILSKGTSFLSGFVISVTNPAKLIIYTSLITSLGLDSLQGGFNINSLFLVIGIVSGSFFWWLLFVFGAKKLNHKFKLTNFKKSRRIKILSGCFIMALGVMILVNLYINI